MGHTEERRRRAEEEVEKIGDERLEREKEGLLDYLEEDGTKQKRGNPFSEGGARLDDSAAAGAT